MIRHLCFALSMMLSVFAVVALGGAIDTFDKALFVLAADYFWYAILSFAVGGAATWLKFELRMNTRGTA